jgi:hypothetical protein
MDRPKDDEPNLRHPGWLGAPRFASITAAYQDGGGAIFWGADYVGDVSAITKEPSSGWSKWFKADEWSGPNPPKYVIQMAATEIEDRLLQFWAINDYTEELWSAAQPAPGREFTPWEQNWNDAPTGLRRLAAVHRRGISTAAIWAIQSDHSLISCYKRAPNFPNGGNTWSRWEQWPATPEKSEFIEITASLQNNGKAALWAIDKKLELWSCCETEPGGSWGNWIGPNWNSAPKLERICACQQGGNRGAILWGIKEDYSLINAVQLTPGGKWSDWSASDWQGAPPVWRLAAAEQAGGTVRLWVTSWHSKLESIAQTSPGGGDWSQWDPNLPQDPVSLKVECANIDEFRDRYEQIRLIGVRDDSGVSEKLTQQEAVEAIEEGDLIWCRVPFGRVGREVPLTVGWSPNGKRYITDDWDQEPRILFQYYDPCL